MKEQSNTYPIAHIGAMKEKRTRFLRLNERGAGASLFRQEADVNAVGSWCNCFDITDFSYDDAAGRLKLDASISFVNNCDSIALRADLLDEAGGRVIASLEEKTVQGARGLQYAYDGTIKDTETVEAAAVVVYAEWSNSEEKDGSAAIFEEDAGIKVEYDHVYPKHEKECVTFRDDQNDQNEMIASDVQCDFTAVDGNEKDILVELYKKWSGDRADYLCLFGRRDGGPRMGMPGKGTLRLKTEEARFVSDAKHVPMVVCAVSEINGNGAFVVDAVDANSSYSANKEIKLVDEKTLTYDLTGPWDTVYKEGMQAHRFNYELTIKCYVEWEREIIPRTFFVSSTRPRGGLCLEQTPCITIKWDCFAEGTRVAMADGSLKPVQDLKEGELLRSEDGSARIVHIGRGAGKDCRKIIAENGAEIVVTAKQKLKSADGWKNADELAEGDCLCTESGNVKISKIEQPADTVQLYSVETDGRTFYANGFVTGD